MRTPVSNWRSCARAVSMLSATRFRFLDVERDVASPGDWNHPEWPKLWLYNAHYFDDLVADDATERTAWHRALVKRWVAENPAAAGNGWEPYPTSLRIVNWIKWALSDNALDAVARDSLSTQAHWLRRRLEHHLLANHLWANAKALVFAGAFFEGGVADGWREKGLHLLRRELDEQFLPDGGHFERSPMYHAIVLEDLLDLVQLADVYPNVFDPQDVAPWRKTAVAAIDWLRALSHPDGEFAFFNDCAMGIAPNLAAIRAYARTVGVAHHDARRSDVRHPEASGYIRLECDHAMVLFDAGEVGPSYQPGHAHADTLSIEASVHGRRLLVNTGTSTYDVGPERSRQRGTAAHNTVQIDGRDSSEVWAGFRVARRARPLRLRFSRTRAEAAHDGYRRLRGRPIHDRTCELNPDGLNVTDRIEGSFRTAVARFHVHPSWTVTLDSPEGGTIRDETDAIAIRWSATGARGCRVEPSTWHPRFGESIANRVIEIELGGAKLETTFTWGDE